MIPVTERGQIIKIINNRRLPASTVSFFCLRTWRQGNSIINLLIINEANFNGK